MRFATLLWTTSSSDCDAWPTYSGGANTAIATLRDTENLGSTWFTSSRPRFVVITPAGEVEEIVTKFRSETTPGLLDEAIEAALAGVGSASPPPPAQDDATPPSSDAPARAEGDDGSDDTDGASSGAGRMLVRVRASAVGALAATAAAALL